MNANYLGRSPLAWWKHWVRRWSIPQRPSYQDYLCSNGDMIRCIDGKIAFISPMNQRNVWLPVNQRNVWSAQHLEKLGTQI
jgi:hypothetical protein